MFHLPNPKLITEKYINRREEYEKKFEENAKIHECLLESMDKEIRSISDKITVDYDQLHDLGESKYQKIIYSVESRPFVWIIVQKINLRMSVSLDYSDLDVADKSIWKDIDSEKGRNHRGLGPEISFNKETLAVMRGIRMAFQKQLEGSAPVRTSNTSSNTDFTRTKKR